MEQGRGGIQQSSQGFPAGFCYWLHVRGRRTKEKKKKEDCPYGDCQKILFVFYQPACKKETAEILQYTIKSVLNIKSTSPSLYILIHVLQGKEARGKGNKDYIVARIVFCCKSRKKKLDSQYLLDHNNVHAKWTCGGNYLQAYLYIHVYNKSILCSFKLYILFFAPYSLFSDDSILKHVSLIIKLHQRNVFLQYTITN